MYNNSTWEPLNKSRSKIVHLRLQQSGHPAALPNHPGHQRGIRYPTKAVQESEAALARLQWRTSQSRLDSLQSVRHSIPQWPDLAIWY